MLYFTRTAKQKNKIICDCCVTGYLESTKMTQAKLIAIFGLLSGEIEWNPGLTVSYKSLLGITKKHSKDSETLHWNAQSFFGKKSHWNVSSRILMKTQILDQVKLGSLDMIALNFGSF